MNGGVRESACCPHPVDAYGDSVVRRASLVVRPRADAPLLLVGLGRFRLRSCRAVEQHGDRVMLREDKRYERRVGDVSRELQADADSQYSMERVRQRIAVNWSRTAFLDAPARPLTGRRRTLRARSYRRPPNAFVRRVAPASLDPLDEWQV